MLKRNIPPRDKIKKTVPLNRASSFSPSCLPVPLSHVARCTEGYFVQNRARQSDYIKLRVAVQLCRWHVPPPSLLIRSSADVVCSCSPGRPDISPSHSCSHPACRPSANSSGKLLLLHAVTWVSTRFLPISTHNIERCIAFYILENYQNFLLYVGQRTGGRDTSVALFYIGSISRSDVCIRKYSENNKYFTGEACNPILVSLSALCSTNWEFCLDLLKAGGVNNCSACCSSWCLPERKYS